MEEAGADHSGEAVVDRLWYPLCRALRDVYEPAPEPEPEPEPVRRPGFLGVLIGFGEPVARRRRRVAEPANIRINRIALAATSSDVSDLSPEDVHLLRRALDSDPEFAPLLPVLDGIPAAPLHADEGGEMDAGAFVFSDLVRPGSDVVRSGAVAAVPRPETTDDGPTGRTDDVGSGTRGGPAGSGSLDPGREPDVSPLGHPVSIGVPSSPDVAMKGEDGALGDKVEAPDGDDGTVAAPSGPVAPVTVTRGGAGLREVAGTRAPVACELIAADGDVMRLRRLDGALVRPVLWPGTWEVVRAKDLGRASGVMEDVGETEFAELLGRDLLVTIDGVLHRPTEAPSFHLACRRTVRAMGRGTSWLVPDAGDGYVMAWRFPDGLGSWGRPVRGRADRLVVTWSPVEDPGPATGMVAPPRADVATGFCLGHLDELVAVRDALAPRLSILRPDLAWHLVPPPVRVVAPEAFPRSLDGLLGIVADWSRCGGVNASVAGIAEGEETLDPRSVAHVVSDLAVELGAGPHGRTREGICLSALCAEVSSSLRREADPWECAVGASGP